MRQGGIEKRPFGRTIRPDDRRWRHKFGIIERARADADRQPGGFDRFAIHLRAACRTKTAFHRVAAVRDHPEGGDRPFISYGRFGKLHVHCCRTARDTLTITTPAQACGDRLSIDREAERTAKTMARMRP
jgi:hypothetical protein